jgi:hypothetical protein
MKVRLRSNITLICFFVLISLAQTVFSQTYDLTGMWKDDNGTTYFLRQFGNRLFWSMDSRPKVHNVFCGTIDRNSIQGQWADLPGGQMMGNGSLNLRIKSNDMIVKVNQSGNYGASVLRRIGSDKPNLMGVWYCYFPQFGVKDARCQIIQNGDDLIFINERGEKSKGVFKDDNSVIATDVENGLIGNLSGKVTNPSTFKGEFTRINWANGSYWIRYIE